MTTKDHGEPVYQAKRPEGVSALGEGFALLRQECEDHRTPLGHAQRFLCAVLQRAEER